LAQGELLQAQRAFWIIKHGIKMSAMPSWSKTLDDAAIWDVVAFVRKLPDMTPETYQQLSEHTP
jgi:mono/diheme cytochrome c family protein